MSRILAIIGVFICMTTNANAEPKPDKIIVYKTIGDTKLTLHIFNPPNHKPSDKTPVIIFFFGGGWVDGTPKQFYNQSSYLASRGIVSICASYRIKSKHNTSPIECVKDGKSAIRWIRSHAKDLGIDPDKIIASGGSAGGHVAAATATLKGFNETEAEKKVNCQPNALVLFNPVIDNEPKGYGYNKVKEYWKDFSPMHNISQEAPPTIIFLGTKDDLIPVNTVKEYKNRMEEFKLRCDLHLYKNQKHGFFNKEKYTETLTETDKFLTSLGYLKDKTK